MQSTYFAGNICCLGYQAHFYMKSAQNTLRKAGVASTSAMFLRQIPNRYGWRPDRSRGCCSSVESAIKLMHNSCKLNYNNYICVVIV